MKWVETTVGDFCPVSYGKGLASGNRNGGRVPVFGSNGIVGWHDSAIVHEPSIIIGRKGSVGEIHFSESPCWPIDTAFYATGSANADIRFAYYLYQTLPIKVNSDSAVPGLNRDFLQSLRVLVPERINQQTIASILATLDEKIRLNTELSKTLEAIAQTIFKSWFIDFDPVHAKARGEQPEGMDAETAALFPDSFEDSELGPIPKGWEVKSLDEIARFLNGLALQKYPPHDGSDNLPVIKIAQLRAGNTTDADFASKQIKSEYIIKDGDILFSWSGTLEVEYWTGGDGALNQHLFKVTGNTVPDWYAFLATRYFLEDFRSIARSKATTMGHIQRGHLTEAKMPLADTGLLGVADSIISPLIELLVSKRIEANQLAALRDALLPRLIAGELEIPEEMLAS